MNRIVLIGNGFDLAHGLKTKYEDFINWYFYEKNDSSEILYKKLIRHYNMFVAFFKTEKVEKSMKEYCTFLKNILKKVGTSGWVDIEKEYYALLIQLFDPNFSNSDRLNPEILNIQLNHLKTMLLEYLNIEKEKKVEAIQSIKGKIYRPIKRRELIVGNLNCSNYSNLDDIMPDNIMLLSFH